MRGFLLLTTLVILLAGSTRALNLSGTILDSETGEPVVGVTIILVGTEIGTATDEDGRFRLTADDRAAEALFDKQIRVTISSIGYVTYKEYPVFASTANVIRLAPTVTMLDDLVVTANRYAKEAYKVSQPITSVTSSEIEKKGYTTVSDAIRNFPGLDMNDAGPFRARPVIRGVFGTRILVLVDGKRLNDQREVVDFAGVSMSLIDVNSIERIEVVNGPASVLYGSDAMGGVINIITKQNRFSNELKPTARYRSVYSVTDQHSSNRFDVGMSTDKYSIAAGFLYREANRDLAPPDGWNERDDEYAVFNPNFYDSLNNARGSSFSRDRLANSRAQIKNYDARFAYKFNEQNRIDLDWGAMRGSDIGFPGVPNASTPFLFMWPKHDRDNISLKYTGTSLSDRMSRLEASVYYEKISKDFFTDFYDGVVILAGPPPNPPTITPLTVLSSTKVEKFGLNFQELYQLSENAMATFGFDAWREQIDGGVTSITRFEGFGPFPFDDTSRSASVPKNNWHAMGVYASGEFELQSARVTLGARLDNYWVNTEETEGYVDEDDNLLPTDDDKYTALNGSLGLVYPLSEDVNAVANVGSAFRVPGVVERFFHGSASGRQTRPNPDIKPERSVALDFGVKAVHDQVSYSIIGFWSSYDDFSQLQIFDSALAGPSSYSYLWRFDNVEDVTIYGIEAVLAASLENGLYGSLGFSYQRGDNNTEDQPIFVSPVKTTLSAGYRHIKHGFFGEFTIRRTEDQNRIPKTSTLSDIATRGYTVVNASAGVKLYGRVGLTLNLNNVLDEVYSEPFNARNPDNPIAESGRNLVLALNAGL